MRTQWSCVFSYRVNFPGDFWAEMSGAVQADGELSEIQLQQLILDNLEGHPDVPSSVRKDEMVITRFGYVSMEPLDIPEVSQDTGQTAPAPAEDTDRTS